MQTKVSYPLNQVLDVKKKRVEDQEKVVKDKQLALEKEKEKLAQREADRDRAIQHDKDKLAQLRQLLDEGTTCPKILQMKAYLKVTKERVKIEEKKVKEQEAMVESAKKALEMAKEELRIKRQDVDKIETHKKDWLKEMQKELELIEEREFDEIGSVIFSANQRRNKQS